MIMLFTLSQEKKELSKIPNKLVRDTLEEAVEDYQIGNYDSSKAMCRRAYEYTLRLF